MTTVLVVEDSRTQRECISHQLRWSGFNAIPAADGIEALEILDSCSPNVVLLDIVMPRMDGYRVSRLIKANPKTQNIPVIFLTGNGQKTKILSKIKYAEAYLSKPWRSRELLNTLKRILPDREKQRGDRLCEPISDRPENANTWTEYGILILKTLELYECRTDAWLKNGKQIIRLYQCALTAFNQALELDSHHDRASKYQAIVQKKWLYLIKKLEKTHPCKVCQYYHGKDDINCAVHPSERPEKICRDWEFQRILPIPVFR